MMILRLLFALLFFFPSISLAQMSHPPGGGGSGDLTEVQGTTNEISVASGTGPVPVVSLPATIDLGGKTSFEFPNAAAPTTDAFGECAGDDNAHAASRGALQCFDGTANTWLIGALSSDTPSNGQVPKWNTGGTITWEDDSTGAGGGDAVTVDGAAVVDPNFDDGGDINFAYSSPNITGTVKADSVALTTDTTGNYVQSVATGKGLTGGAAGSEGATLTLGIGTLQKCAVIKAATTADDYPLEKFPGAITITDIHVYAIGGTNVVGGLDECTGTAGVCSSVTAVDADITGTAGSNVEDDGTLTNGGIAAGNWVQWHTTSVSGTNTSLSVCFNYTID